MVATSTIQRVITEGRRLRYLNRHADACRCGLILSGPARTGKTTCLAQLGKTIETMHMRGIYVQAVRVRPAPFTSRTGSRSWTPGRRPSQILKAEGRQFDPSPDRSP